MAVAAPPSPSNLHINRQLQLIPIRAEMNDEPAMVSAFVEVEQIASGLQRIDNQVIYGRRGTGKTHALRKLAHTMTTDGDLSIYLDLRKIGSNNGLYADGQLPLSRRATQLLIDVMEAFHTELLRAAIEDDAFAALFPYLDPIAEAATDVRVEGPVKVSNERTSESATSIESGWRSDARGAMAGASGTVSYGRGRQKQSSEKSNSAVERSGTEAPRLIFGRLASTIEDACNAIRSHRVWFLLDEWSSVPIDLQPYLADMLRRVFFTCSSLTIKIGAVERRSRFALRSNSTTYVGIELGADTAATLNLDEHLLASENADRAQSFFATLLRRHLETLLRSKGQEVRFADTSSFVRTVFSENAFPELVKAAEGIPRDAINIVGLAAGSAQGRPIGLKEVQLAARRYFLQDKESGVAGNNPAQHIWERLQREVVGGRQSRTFLVKRSVDGVNPGLLDLYDARLIHLLQAGLSAPSRPGISYDGYSVDYGSYVQSLRELTNLSIWDARSHPWIYEGDEVYLPDRFDEGVVFTIGKGTPKAKRKAAR